MPQAKLIGIIAGSLVAMVAMVSFALDSFGGPSGPETLATSLEAPVLGRDQMAGRSMFRGTGDGPTGVVRRDVTQRTAGESRRAPSTPTLRGGSGTPQSGVDPGQRARDYQRQAAERRERAARILEQREAARQRALENRNTVPGSGDRRPITPPQRFGRGEDGSTNRGFDTPANNQDPRNNPNNREAEQGEDRQKSQLEQVLDFAVEQGLITPEERQEALDLANGRSGEGGGAGSGSGGATDGGNPSPPGSGSDGGIVDGPGGGLSGGGSNPPPGSGGGNPFPGNGGGGGGGPNIPIPDGSGGIPQPQNPGTGGDDGGIDDGDGSDGGDDTGDSGGGPDLGGEDGDGGDDPGSGGGDDGGSDPPTPSGPQPVEALWVRAPLEIIEPSATVNSGTLTSRYRYDLYLSFAEPEPVQFVSFNFRYAANAWRAMTFGSAEPFRLPGESEVPFSDPQDRDAPPTPEDIFTQFEDDPNTRTVREFASRRVYQSYVHFGDGGPDDYTVIGAEVLEFMFTPVLSGVVIPTPFGTTREPVSLTGISGGKYHLKIASLVFDAPPIVDLDLETSPQLGYVALSLPERTSSDFIYVQVGGVDLASLDDIDDAVTIKVDGTTQPRTINLFP